MTKTYETIFLQPGDKVLLSHRRMFTNDKSRFFVGTVVGFNENNGLLKVAGFSMSQPIGTSHFSKKTNLNTKIVSLTSGSLIAYQLPEKIDVATAVLKYKEEGLCVLEDGHGVFIDLTE